MILFQVLSNTVATALDLRLTGKDEVEETARFVTMFDRFFDCLNVTDLNGGRRTRNAFKSPYRSADDFRLKVSIMCPVYRARAQCYCDICDKINCSA